MARFLYGDTPGEVITDGAGNFMAGVTYQVSTTRGEAGLTTDIAAGPTGSVAGGVVTSDAFGRFSFYGPDGFGARRLWVRQVGGSQWYALDPDPASLSNTYLTQEDAAATLLTQDDAAATYAQQGFRDPLRKWYAALAGRRAAPAQIVAFGDSITEGTGNSDAANRWQNVLQAALRSRYGVSGGAAWPFIPGKPQTSAPGFPVTVVGATTAANWGLGVRTAQLFDPSHSLTYTFTGTSFKVMYVGGPTTGDFTVEIDGGAPITVDTNGPAATTNGQVWTSPALTPGDHTVILKRPSTGVVYIEGVLTYDGDEDSGIRVLDAAKHGINSSLYTQSQSDNTARSLAGAGGASLAVIALGTNDYSNGITPATFRANLETLVARLRVTGGFDGSVLLLGLYKGQGRDEATWATYLAELEAMAAADPDTAYLNLRDRMPDVPTPIDDPSGPGLFSDALHPNDAGSGWIADAIADYLSLRV